MSLFCQKNRQLINVVILGLGFLFLFGAFQTSSMFQTTVLSAVKAEPNGTFTGNGLVSLAIIYSTFAFSNWLAPIVVTLLKPKYSMFASSLVYSLFIASFLYPITWILYTGSVLLGVAASVLWTAQGNYLSLNSNSHTIKRNTTIFWALLQSSLIFGNIVQYSLFHQSEGISTHQRILLYSIFTSCGIFGTLLLLCLRSHIDNEGTEVETESDSHASDNSNSYTPIEAFFQSFRLAKTPTMLLLFLVFGYTGFELTFYSGVYGTAVGRTLYFGDKAQGYIGLSGVMIGIGEIIGSISATGVSKIWKKVTPDIVIIVGLFVHVSCFYLIFLSFPFDSPQKPSSQETFITPNAGIVILCAFLLGFGDSIYNTLVISLLGNVFQGIDNPSAFALFKFLQSLTSGIGFAYSTFIGLQWQLLILCITGILGTVAFVFVEQKTRLLVLARNQELCISNE